MSLAVHQFTITDAAGNIVPGASVRVTDAETGSLATLKPNRDGSGSLGNPFSADTEGFAKFYVAQGRYNVRVTFAGNQRDHVNLCLFADTSLNYSAPVYQLATPNPGTTDNYAPAGFDSATTFLDLVPGGGDASIGGLVGMVDGQRLQIRNGHGSNNVVLLKESAGSTAANRFSLPFDITLLPGDSRTGTYIGSLSRLVL